VLSCIARVEQRFGVGHVVSVLTGASTQNIRKFNHEQLSTYGLLREFDGKTVQNLIYQLVDQGLIDRVGDEYPVLKLNSASIEVLKGARDVTLVEPKTRVKKSRVEEASWEGVDRGLFEALRELRKAIAAERGVPAFVIFGDNTLRELAAARPSSFETLRRIKGIGQQKAADFGQRFLQLIADYCKAQSLDTNQFGVSAAIVSPKKPKDSHNPNAPRELAIRMFGEGRPIDEISQATGRARSTINGYLTEWIVQARPADVLLWVSAATYQRVRDAARGLETRSVKPVYEMLGGEVPYEDIRIVVAHIEAMTGG
jgi:ATP-dependent DNA helicase RecQ